MNASPSEPRALSGPSRDYLRSLDTQQHLLPCRASRGALWLVGLLALPPSLSAAPIAPEGSAIRSILYDLPLTFEVNQGQTDARVDFLARGQGYTLFLTPTEAVFALTPPRGSSKRSGNGREPDVSQRSVMRMQLVDSAPDPQVQGLDELLGKVNYFRGNDSTQWRANVGTYKRVKYTSVYPGVDLIYYGQPRQLEYDFIVAPGTDPGMIKLAFAGVDDSTIDTRGDLVLKTAGAPLRFHRPIVYQVDGARRHVIAGSYVQMSPHEFGFRVGPYDATRPLIIDPVLSYSTYLGGSGEETGEGIAVDATGAAYVSGTTFSTDFPTANALQPAPGGPGTPGVCASDVSDVFVAKLTPDGTALVYATYLGGSDSDGDFADPEGRTSRIAVDSAGNAYIAGKTQSPDFPTVGALQATMHGRSDAFIAKLSADGSQLLYSTYLGGRSDESGTGIAVDAAGAAYVTGVTRWPDFPAVNAFQPVCAGSVSPENVFVAKLTPDGTRLAYSTYLGGSSSETPQDIAVDSLGSAYVTGFTSSANFPTVNTIQPYRGFQDIFVTKFAPNGKSLIYSTFYGGSTGDDRAGSIAVDASGAAYLTGETLSSDFPTVNALQPVTRSGRTAFVVKLAPEGSAPMYATYLGGSGIDTGNEVVVDTAGAAYVTGFTTSRDFPTMNPLQPAHGGGDTDIFVAKLAPDGAALVHSTYLGGINPDQGYSIVLDLEGAVYITGFTSSPNFPTVQPLQATLRSTDYIGDAIIAKFTADSFAGSSAVSGSISGNQNGEGNGGGSIDALLVILLAQFALTRARQRRRSRE